MAGSVQSETEGLATGSVESRIETMARWDRITAWIFTVVMWIVLLFTYFAVSSVVHTGAISVALIVSLAVLGVFNTASIVAMIRSYARDKDFIYREDIVNLDRNRRRGAAEGEPEGGYKS